jgi:hypothetical protein
MRVGGHVAVGGGCGGSEGGRAAVVGRVGVLSRFCEWQEQAVERQYAGVGGGLNAFVHNVFNESNDLQLL